MLSADADYRIDMKCISVRKIICCNTIWFSLWPYETLWQNRTGSTLPPDGTNPLQEPMLIDHQRCSVALIYKQFHMRSSWTESVTWVRRLHVWPFTFLLPYISWANELNPNNCHTENIRVKCGIYDKIDIMSDVCLLLFILFMNMNDHMTHSNFQTGCYFEF